MVSVYGNVKGVSYSIWKDGDETEPSFEGGGGEVEELYFNSRNGDLHVSIITDEECVYVDIPVKASKGWNKFVETLPVWDH